MALFRILSGLPLFFLVSCSVVPTYHEGEYAAIAKEHLQALHNWSFAGRISVTSSADSWSANLEWRQKAAEDWIQLSGPFGQSASLIHLNGDGVSLDRGDGNVQYSDAPDQFVSEQLGVFVPVRALAYWVKGLPAPTIDVDYAQQGFAQAGWRVVYTEWQAVKGRPMPRKITVTKDNFKLKLVCDEWVID